MTTLTVSATDDYSADDLSGTDVITFTNAVFTVAVATFANTQFGTQIDKDVQINTSIGGNTIVVNGGSISALGWTFGDWFNGDVVQLNGSTTADVILGSTEGDLITGSTGADVLFGGFGNDTIALDAGDFINGELIDGSVGAFDSLLLRNGISTIDFSGNNVVSNIEWLTFGTGGGSGIFAASNFGTAADKINTVMGNTGQDTVQVSGSAIDFSTITFFSWSANDTVILNGTNGNDSLRGTAFADQFILTSGEDTVIGGGGNDTVAAFDASAGDRLNGGTGSGDTLQFLDGTVDLRILSLLTGFENVTLGLGSGGGTLLSASGAQIRSGAISSIDGSSTGSNALNVFGKDIDLTDVTFAGWETTSTIALSADISASSKLIGSSKAETILGFAGNDALKGGGGKDTINGGGGTDRADYSDKTKRVDIALKGSTAANVKVDGTVQDLILNIEGVIGGSAGDKLTGDGRANTFRGKGGSDTLDGAGGSDTADFSDKTKKVQVTLKGSSFATVKVNGNNEDKIKNIEDVIGGSAADKLTGDGRNNTFTGKGGADTLDGADGSDTANYSDKTKKVEVTLNGSTATTVKVNGNNEDSIKNVENVSGGSAGDRLTGDGGKNTFKGNGGKDTLNGAGGSDTADYSDRGHQVLVTLNGSTAVNVKIGGAVEDSIKNIESVTGGRSNDKLTGDSLANRLSGNAGHDTIKGAGGKDTLVGGEGEDSLTGGSGEDSFLFNVLLKPANLDKIADFKHADDTIQLENSIMKALGTGSLAANQFLVTAGTADATTATQRIIYDETNGVLYYDADGDGADGPAPIAILTNLPTNIDHTDFKIV